MGVTVIEFRFFNQITKKKKKRRTWTIDEKYFYEYLTHTTSNYVEIFVGVKFYGDLHLDVIRC